jgi:hypothetical protein
MFCAMGPNLARQCGVVGGQDVRDIVGDRQPAAAVAFGPHHIDVTAGKVDMFGQ